MCGSVHAEVIQSYRGGSVLWSEVYYEDNIPTLREPTEVSLVWGYLPFSVSPQCWQTWLKSAHSGTGAWHLGRPDRHRMTAGGCSSHRANRTTAEMSHWSKKHFSGCSCATEQEMISWPAEKSGSPSEDHECLTNWRSSRAEEMRGSRWHQSDSWVLSYLEENQNRKLFMIFKIKVCNWKFRRPLSWW